MQHQASHEWSKRLVSAKRALHKCKEMIARHFEPNPKHTSPYTSAHVMSFARDKKGNVPAHLLARTSYTSRTHFSIPCSNQSHKDRRVDTQKQDCLLIISNEPSISKDIEQSDLYIIFSHTFKHYKKK